VGASFCASGRREGAERVYERGGRRAFCYFNCGLRAARLGLRSGRVTNLKTGTTEIGGSVEANLEIRIQI
jgi:hypothetical protein